MTTVITRTLFLILVAFCLTLCVFAQQQQQTDAPAGFNKIEQMVPMRDGVKLHTIIFAPKNQSGPLPIIFNRTPYGIDGIYRAFPGSLAELIDEGFIFAFQDIRGKFKSEGQFVMLRNPRGPGNKTEIDEGTDTNDTIDWMLKNVTNNNGRVGMAGTSYGAWLVMMAVIDPHPALKVVTESASPSDMFLGDDFHHNGAFRLSYGFEYAYALESSNGVNPFKFDIPDTYQWYLNLGALSNVNAKYFNGKLPTWENFVNHPNYDEFWQQQALINQIKQTKVPIMHVAGWWDQEDFYGPVKAYEILGKNDPNNLNYLVAGPWNHGGWNRATGDKLGDIDFGSPASQYFRAKILAPWFAHYLKDKGTLKQPEATTFETGTNQWTSFDAWPPRENVTKRNLYFNAGKQLSFDKPKASGEQFDSYVSDPANPVPYRHQPIDPTFAGARWPTWLVEDQRFVADRPDVLTLETEPLTEDVHIAGDIVAHLFASTTGTDSDWAVKLIDVYPESYSADPKMSGFQLMISDEILRGRFRNSFSKPEPIPANKVVGYTIDLHTNDHAFLKGHRIMVQVQSTWFPVYDRNPQKFVPNIFNAQESDFQKATQRVYRSSANASYVELPVLAGGR
jgi:putative CocE/NonD family hydrolase